MDDFLASQQLVEEETRAEHAASDNRGKSPPAMEEVTADLEQEHPIDLTTHSDLPASQQTIPSSPPSFTVTDRAPRPPLDSDNNYARPSPHDVEVPDSQLTPKAKKLNRLPMTPITTSSFAIPASVHGGTTQEKSKGSQKRARAAAGISNAASEQGASASKQASGVVESAEAAAASDSRTKRKYKKSYATPPSTAMGSQRVNATPEQNIPATQRSENVATDEDGGMTLIERLNKKKMKKVKRGRPRKSLEESVPTSSIDDANTAHAGDDAMSPSSKQLAEKLLRLKRSKPSSTTSRLAGQCKSKHRAPAVEADGTMATEGEINAPFADAAEQDFGPDEERAPEETLPQHTTPKPKANRRSNSTATNTPARRYTRKSLVDTAIMAADRELNNSRMLNHPPILLTSGSFTEDEDEVLRRAIKDYQQRKDLGTEQLVSIIQWTDPSLDHARRRKRSEWTQADFEDEAESKELWDEIKNTEPQLRRKLEIVRRHVQARYHTFKSGAWTEDEDNDLRRMMKQYPSQWKVMSLLMGDRSAPDIQNRWKDYVQYGDQRNTGSWTQQEEQSLLSALVTVMQRDEDERAEKGLPSIAEYSNKDINWSAVCVLIDNVRSRLQCTVKWTQMKERDASANVRPVYRRGRTPDPTRPAAPTPKSSKKPRKGEAQAVSEEDGNESVPQKKRRRSRKSEDQPALGDDGEDSVPPKKKRRTSRRSQALVVSEDDFDETPKEQAQPASEEDFAGPAPQKKRRRSRKSAAPLGPEDNHDESVPQQKRARTRKSEARPASGEEVGMTVEPKKRRKSQTSRPETAEATLEESHELDIAVSAGHNDDEQPAEAPVEENDEQDFAIPAENDYEEGEQEAKDDSEAEASDFPYQDMSPIPERPTYSSIITPQESPSSAGPQREGAARMKWGDKFDIVETIASLDIMYEEDVDWRELASLMQNTWSVRDLQTAVKQLLSLVPDQETFAETIVDVRDYLKAHIDRKELREYYDPFAVIPIDDGENENAKLLEKDETPAKAKKSNTKRKRKSTETR
jgi:hypothetical protein